MGSKMRWHRIANSLTADSSDMNENFSFVASGSIDPKASAGSSFAATDSVYDIGSDSARWKTLFCKDLISDTVAASGDSLWTLVTEVNLDATALSVDITGLNGDDDIEYMLIEKIENGSVGLQNYYRLFNTDTSIYWNEYCYAWNGTNKSTSGGTSSNFTPMTFQTSTSFCISKSLIHAKSGHERPVLYNYYIAAATDTMTFLYMGANVWDNIADTITSISVYGVMGADTHIELWSRK